MSYPSKEVMDETLHAVEQPTVNPHRDFLIKRHTEDVERVVAGEMTASELATRWADRDIQLENRADHDELTGLLNLHGFTEALNGHLITASQHDIPAYLAFFDGDKLKEINDTVGKLAGNKVIQTYADALKRVMASRPEVTALAGRFGGDEFMFFVMGPNQQETIEIFEDLRKAVPDAVRQNLGLPDLHNTISIGAVKVQPDETVNDLIQRADDNLKEAKKGRNQLVFEGTTTLAA